MKKSGLADSPFFIVPPKAEEAISPPPAVGRENAENKETKEPKNENKQSRSVVVKKVPTTTRDTTTPSNLDTMTPRYQETIVEIVRKAVKEYGKEAATHRFTPEEKKKVADIIYTYKASGIKTCENEITRIALNFVVADYKENGENSILDTILKALNG